MSAVVYIVRHGEVAHHRSDIELTARGRAQARAAGEALASRIHHGDVIYIFHSPVLRVVETAQLLFASLDTALHQTGDRPDITLRSPQPDGALENARFIPDMQHGMQEPSLLYAEMDTPEFMQTLSPARAEFYRGFWSSDDPMGYWLTHDSASGAENPATVLQRFRQRLSEIFSAADARSPIRHIYILVTHSGAMRALLRDALGADPGEPNFCEMIALEATNQADCVRLVYRGRTSAYALL